jgi:hypothetical protein
MCLLAINWKQGTPPNNFVGFAIEYMEPSSALPIGPQFDELLKSKIAGKLEMSLEL